MNCERRARLSDSLGPRRITGVIALRDEPRLEAADEIERADAALAALAAQHFSTGTATVVYIYTTDTATGEGAESVLASEGYGDSVTFVNGFRFIEELLADDL